MTDRVDDSADPWLPVHHADAPPSPKPAETARKPAAKPSPRRVDDSAKPTALALQMTIPADLAANLTKIAKGQTELIAALHELAEAVRQMIQPPPANPET